MKIVQMRTNHIVNPLGFRLRPPTLSWVAENDAENGSGRSGAAPAQKQTAAQVDVALDEAFSNIVHTSGRRADMDSLGYVPSIELRPRTRYWWRVQVWADNGETATGGPAFFETGKLDEPWQARWITPPFSREVHPYLRKHFQIPGKIACARAYVCGLGLYELEINGRRAGNEYLAPGFHAYDFWLQYQTYDVTSLLVPGGNAVGAWLGNGWYKGRFGFDGGYTELYGDRFALLCELRVRLEDGTELTVGTDTDWKCHASPVLFSGIYDGEWYDANREIEGWSRADCREEDWAPAEGLPLGTEKLSERRSLPVVVKERRKPVEVIRNRIGETILDFGQNMAGWVEFESAFPKGRRIKLQYGEVLQGGNFYNANLRTAEAEMTYLSSGEKAIVRPHFTYYGFRYVKVVGAGAEFDAQKFTACVVYSDLAQTGSIKTSDPSVDRLFQNALWGQRSNFLDVPTDCPQRDERMGWTGDAQIFAGTASFNMYTPAFYTKYLTDLEKEQWALNGSVPFVVPQIKPQTAAGNNAFVRGHGSCAWGDAATIIPWTMYLFYGDKSLLAEQYGIMRDWVDYIRRQTEENGTGFLWKTGFHFADWLALDNPDSASPFGGTDPYYVASAYYRYSSLLLSKAARVLGKTEDAERYAALTENIRQAIQADYFLPDGSCRIETQTALVVALYMELVPQRMRAGLIEALKTRIRQNGMHLDTGFVGTPYLCRVLSDNGANDVAFSLLLNKEYPGWLHEVELGATTVWERWNSLLEDGSISGTGMNSLNHYAYGSVAEWMYRDLCGLNPVEDAPGFKKVLLRPQPDKRLTHAAATYDSPSGTFEVAWDYEADGTLDYTFAIPFDTEAAVVLQNAHIDRMYINGSPDNRTMQQDAETVRFTLSAGCYTIRASPIETESPH